MKKVSDATLVCCAMFLIVGTASGQVGSLAMDSGNGASLLDRSAQLVLHGATLGAALTRLSEASGSPVAFSPSLVAAERKRVDCDCREASVRAALDHMLEGTPFAYRELGGEILVLREHTAPVVRPPRYAARLTRLSLPSPIRSAASRPREVQGTVTGQVTEADTQRPLAGARVQVAGTALVGVTDANGRFRIDAVPAGEVEIEVQLLGYVSASLTVRVAENATVSVDFQLALDPLALDELVVTAFGIQRESRGLSYAVQGVAGESISRTGNRDVLSGLQGKVAGITVRQQSGVPGAMPQVTIRGSRSFTGGNQPLYVIDGMPIAGRPVDIHPGDIETINVLKGPTAAALYGLRASNGAIIISTKGAQGAPGGPVITYDANTSFDRLSVWPEVQQTYMQGTPEGGYEPNSAFSWGPRIDEMGRYVNQMGEEVAAHAFDNVGTFFRTGHTWNHNVNISHRLESGSYSLSLGSTDQSGIVANSRYRRLNAKADGGFSPTERWTVRTSLNYTKGDRDSFLFSNGGNSSAFYAAFWAPISYDLANFPTHVEGEPFNQLNFRGQHDNIYWLLENNKENLERDRFFGSLHSTYSLTDWLSVDYRLGLDTYNESLKTVFALGSGTTGGRTNPPSGGRINDQLYTFQQVNSNLSFLLSTAWRDDLQLDLRVGNEINDVNNRRVTADGTGIVIGGFDHISNTTTRTNGEAVGRNRVVGFFGDLSASWQDALYLTITGRTDVVSNMPRGNRRFFYPSAGLALVFTELTDFGGSWLPFGKLRASIAEVGQAGPTFSTQSTFAPGGVSGFSFPFGGVSGFTLSGDLNSSDLEPENTRTIELGVDLRFIGGRLGLDYTYYNTTSKGQIFRVPVPVSTGYSTELRNAGEMNTKGHEVVLSASPLQVQDFAWDVIANFSTFDNRVISLAEGITQLSLGGEYVSIVAHEGEPYPIIWGPAYARDPETGQVVVDSRETLPNGQPNPFAGFPLRDTENRNLGKVYPDFEIGFTNTVAYKALSLSAQIDWRSGGHISSGTNRLGDLYGASKKTEWREDDYVWPGKKGYFDDNGNLIVTGDNDLAIKRGRTYHQYIDPIRESIVYDASYVKLREITLNVQVPQSLLRRTFFADASVFVSGRNFLLHSKLPNADPETNYRTEQGNFQGEENLTYPLSKSVVTGFRVRF